MMRFSEWLVMRESWEDRAYAPVRAELNKPLTLQMAVLFPVSHGQGVATDEPSLKKMQELMQRGVNIWYEGEQIEDIVAQFVKQNRLEKLPTHSWEPEAQGKQINSQAALLNAIFGGGAKRMLYMMYSHPNVAEPLTQAGHQVRTNDNKGTSQVQWNAQSSYRPTILEVLMKSSFLKQYGDEQGWAGKSAQATPDNIRQLLSQMPQLSGMLDMEATPQNMHKFLSLGQNLAYNISYGKGRANTNPLARTESEAQLQRDTHLVDLMQRQGGIFFAGADHIGNVRKLLKGQ